MKKILFTQMDVIEIIVENGNPIGGAVVESFVWMKALNQLGVRVQLLKESNETRRVLEKFQWIELIDTFDSKKGIKWLRYIFYRFPKIYLAIKKNNPDYIYESIPNWNSFFLAMMCKSLKVKHIIRIANDNMLDERIKLRYSKFTQFFIQKGFSFCDFLSVQNQFQFNALRKKYPEKKIFKLYNPFEIENEIKIKKYDEKKPIVWVANFRYQKNLKLLFNVASLLCKENFKIAGVGLFPLDNETESYIEKLKDLPNVEFLGSVSRNEILHFFSKSKFLLNTSRYEGFSNTFLEAMMTGTPILTTENVNPDGIIDTFGLGYLYKDEKDLKQILSNISETDYLQKSKNCIEYVQKNHDHLVLAQKLLDFLKA
jgi:glycosyltransferase involved in cell wall biosynthesis